MTNDEFIITCKGKTIKGKFTYLKINEFAIRLSEPESELCAGSGHVPVLALAHNRFLDGDKLTDYGFQYATRLLIGLYSDHLFLEQNKEDFEDCTAELSPFLMRYKEKMESIINKVAAEKREFKKKFKSNEINEKEYTRKLRDLQNEKFEAETNYHDKLRMKRNELIDKYFADNLSCSLSYHISKKAEELANES